MSAVRFLQVMSYGRIMSRLQRGRHQHRIAWQGVQMIHGRQKSSASLLKNDATLHGSLYQISRNMSALPSAWFEDYEKGCEEFNCEVPDHFNFSRDVIDKWAEVEMQELASGEAEEGDRRHWALWWTNDHGREFKWTFKEISEYSKRIAFVLTGPCGLQRGDHLMVMLPSYPLYWLLCLACIRTGVIFVPASTYHLDVGVRLRLQASKAKCIFTDEGSIGLVDKVAVDCPHLKTKVYMPSSRASHTKLGWLNYAHMYKTSSECQAETVDTLSDHTMVIHFTSATTGKPKMVEHTQASYGIASIVNGKYHYDLTREDVYWGLTDPGWAKTAWGTFGTWIQGACIFAHHYTHFDAASILKLLENYPITALTTSPPLWRQLVQEDLATYNLSDLRCSFSGGELLDPEVIEKWEEATGTPLKDGYGQTETLLLTSNFKCLESRPGSLGKPVPGCEMTIIDADGKELPRGEIGEIAVRVKPNRPLGFFKGYKDDPAKTLKVFKGDYYMTGDMGYVDKEGYFWYVSRSGDLIYTAGHVVSPFEVEQALMEHEAVAECAVVSSPDVLQLTGQMVKAFVVLTEDGSNLDQELLLDEIHQHCVNNLDPYAVPKQIAFLDMLPTTVTGKLKRAQLRKNEWQHHDY